MEHIIKRTRLWVPDAASIRETRTRSVLSATPICTHVQNISEALERAARNPDPEAPEHITYEFSETLKRGESIAEYLTRFYNTYGYATQCSSRVMAPNQKHPVGYDFTLLISWR